MSLTSFLTRPTVKARFKQDWPLPSPRPQSCNWPMVVPPRFRQLVCRPQILGTAFDYIFRFHLRRLNPSAEEPDNWVAEHAVQRLPRNLRNVGQYICEKARVNYQRFLDGNPLRHRLLELTLQLAQLDLVYRAGVLPPEDDFYVFQEEIIELRQLAEACDWSQWRTSGTCRLNPTFGETSRLVGGADADFQIDGTLYELKTVKTAAISLAHYHQLIGYAVLNYMDNGPPIDELAIYFSRFAQTVHWPAPCLSEERYKPFLSWFTDAAKNVSND